MRRTILLLFVLTGCGENYPLDDLLRLNHVQAKGTHNSYHIEPAEPFDDGHRYTHAPLDVQLDAQGVRQFELDLHRHKSGHFEIFHLPGGVDSETTCRRFTDCLQVVKAWSDEHEEHLPVLFWLEPKDSDLDWADENYDLFVGEYGAIEAEILSVWPRDRILAPDDVRGAHDSLPKAITTDGWPTLRQLRGRVIFSLLDGEEHRESYLEAAPNLSGKLMFVASSSTSDPHAALFKVNNAMARSETVRDLAKLGFIITSNTDGPGSPSEQNRARLDASLAAGAHFLSTDIPVPITGEDYFAEIPMGNPARCNPIAAPPECTPADLERLASE